MKERSDNSRNVPWLAIAVALVVLAVIAVAGLGSVDPPPAPVEPRTVQQTIVDLGGWDPFRDVGQRPAASQDAGAVDH